MARQQEIRLAKKLRAEGATYREIGERLGVGRSTVTYWLNPDAYRRHHIRECPQCGGRMKRATAGRGGLCQACRSDEADLRARLVVRLWREGRSIQGIADELNTSVNCAGVTINTLREKGYELPYRRSVQGPRFPEQLRAAQKAA
jgi:transposase